MASLSVQYNRSFTSLTRCSPRMKTLTNLLAAQLCGLCRWILISETLDFSNFLITRTKSCCFPQLNNVISPPIFQTNFFPWRFKHLGFHYIKNTKTLIFSKDFFPPHTIWGPSSSHPSYLNVLHGTIKKLITYPFTQFFVPPCDFFLLCIFYHTLWTLTRDHI